MVLHRAHQGGYLAGVVLPVAVDLDHVVVAVLERELEARLHGAPNAEIKRVAQYARARGHPLAARGVRRPVVDHEDVHVGSGPLDRAHHAAHRVRLVVGGNDRQAGAFEDHSAVTRDVRARRRREVSAPPRRLAVRG